MSIYATFAAPTNKKARKSGLKTKQDTTLARDVLHMPLFIDILGMEVNLELTDVKSTSFSINKLDQFNEVNKFYFKNRAFLKYDDNSLCQFPSFVEADSTKSSIFSWECYLLSHYMNVLEWRLRKPTTIIMGQNCFAKT